MKKPEWIKDNCIVIIAALVCVTLIVIVAMLKPPRYQKAGAHNHLILDTKTGKMLKADGTPVKCYQPK